MSRVLRFSHQFAYGLDEHTMKSSLLVLVIACLLSALSGCGDDGHGHHGHHGHDHSHDDVPDEYSMLQNPREGDADAIEEGGQLWSMHCAGCHGVDADGQGSSSSNLDPRPPGLNDPSVLQTMTDGYLYWRIAEGGDIPEYSSQMPAYVDVLSPEQHWAIISFLRSF